MKRLFLILSALFCATLAQAQPFTPTPGKVTICTPDGIACSGMDGVMIASDTTPFVQTPGKVTICDPDGTNCSGLTGGGGGGGLSSVSADAPLTGLGTSGNHLAMPAATNSVAGYLTAADHTSFAAKQSALTFAQSITNTAGTVALTGDTGSPGVSKYYGTNAGGTRGFFDVPSPGAGATTFTALTDVPSTYVGQADKFVKVKSDETSLVFISPPAGAGDVSSNTTVSVDGEVVLFSATSGKTVKRATGSGIPHLTSGVLSSVSTIATADIANNAVDFTKTQQIATARVLGRSTAGTGNIEEITLSGLSLASGVLSNSGVLSATGTASQVTVSASTGNVVFSLPATINVNTSGNAATATALAANGTNCAAGQAPRGVDASGNAENCFTALDALSVDAPLTGLGTSASHLAMPAATDSVDGYLTAADHTTFAAKQSALTFSQSLSNSGGTVTLSGDQASPGVTKLYGTNASGVKGWYDQPAGGGGGATNFTGLADVPSSYSGQADRFVKVNSGATGLVFVAAPAGAGNVTGPASSVDGEIALYSSTSGTVIKRATGSGIPHLTSGVLSSVSTIATADVANNAIDFTKTQQIATNRLLGRSTAATGNIETITPGTGLSLSSGTLTNSGVTSLAGTASQVTVSAATGVVTISLPATINVNTTGNAATATALAVNGTNCTGQQAAKGIDALGNAEGCFTPSGAGNVSGPASAIADHLVQFNGTSGTLIKDGLGVASANTASAVVQRDASGNFSAGTITATLTGNATTATALAANGTNCGAGQFAIGVDANGNAEGCTSFTSAYAATGSKEGTGTKFQMFTGVDPNTDDCAKFDADHNLVGAGGPCGGAAPGLNTQLIYNNGGLFGPISGATSNGTNTTFADGTARLTNPWIGTGILDANGHTLFKFSPNVAAVVGFEFVTDATANPATITLRPYGVTNANLAITGLGTGSVCLTSCNGQGAFSVNSITFNGASSGSATVGAASAAGSPAQINWPTATGAANSFLMSNGATPQQTSWVSAPIKVASGTKALATSAISSGACTSAQTLSASGVLTTDTILASFNGDPTGVTGFIPSTSGMLTVIVYPSADTINVKVCNNTNASITPGATTLNLAAVR